MSDLISKAEVLETYAELYDVFDDNKEIQRTLSKVYDKINKLPSAQPEQRLSCKNCIHLGHGYRMPCQNCKRNQMLPDWYEV